MQHAGVVYQFPVKVAKKYWVSGEVVKPDELFSDINKKYTKPGALLKGN